MFDETVVANLFPHHSPGARHALVHRAVQAAQVLRLKRRLYCLAPRFRHSTLHPFVIAGALHAPSQVSLESALAYHRLIPEAVRQVASVTLQRSRTFDTPLGRFEFVRVPSNALRAGVRAEQVAPQSWAFVSTPLRAIADLIYLRREVRWERDGLAFLTDSMRIEVEDLQQISGELFDEVAASLRSQRVQGYLRGLRQELAR